jgi:hypothetical protein
MDKVKNAAELPEPAQSDNPSQHARHSRHRRHHSARRIPSILALAGLSLLAVVLMLFGVIKINSLNNTNDLLTFRLQENEEKLINMGIELREAQRQLEAAVGGRFPQLRRLEFDKVLPLHEGLVQNIVFTLIKKSDKNLYEYKLVMGNDTGSLSTPEVKVLLFGQLGVQLGTDELPKQEPLLRGETRSYSSIIDLAVPGEPYYFYVVTK